MVTLEEATRLGLVNSRGVRDLSLMMVIPTAKESNWDCSNARRRLRYLRTVLRSLEDWATRLLMAVPSMMIPHLN